MKVIFLDHDGVICLPQQWGGRNKKKLKYAKNNPDNRAFFDSDYPVEVRFDNFDEKAIKVLNEIIKETDCEIIVSSDWRLTATLEEMGEYYEMKGIIKKPIGYTKQFDYNERLVQEIVDGEVRLKRFDTPEEERAWEIKKYLEEHPEITHWVAIDDLDMRYYSWYAGEEDIVDWGLKNFVYTIYDEGIKQTGLKNKILKYLIDERN